MNKAEEIVGIIKQLNALFIKINKKIHVAIVVEAWRQYGAEHPQLCDLVLPAQGDDLVNIHLDQLHTMQIYSFMMI